MYHLGRGRDDALGYLLQLWLSQAQVITQAQAVIVCLQPAHLTHQLVTPQLLQQHNHLPPVSSPNSRRGPKVLVCMLTLGSSCNSYTPDADLYNDSCCESSARSDLCWQKVQCQAWNEASRCLACCHQVRSWVGERAYNPQVGS